MEFRNIVISYAARLSLRLNQLVIAQEQEVTIPIEDISALMLESKQVQISAAVLEQLAVQGVTVYLCDDRHHPSVQLLPIHQFCRKRKLLFSQFECPKPLQKQLWKAIIQQKVKNQATCLQLLGRDGADKLFDYATQVLSDDSSHVEAAAAAFYFPKLFGSGFTRGEDCAINSALNYGYAIVRSSLARNLVLHGLEPCIGLHHRSELNQFNLADDLIEPYRPLVDLLVAQLGLEDEDTLSIPAKRKLFNLTNYLVAIHQKKYRTMIASDRSAASLADSILSQENFLLLPQLIPLEEGRYE